MLNNTPSETTTYVGNVTDYWGYWREDPTRSIISSFENVSACKGFEQKLLQFVYKLILFQPQKLLFQLIAISNVLKWSKFKRIYFKQKLTYYIELPNKVFKFFIKALETLKAHASNTKKNCWYAYIMEKLYCSPACSLRCRQRTCQFYITDYRRFRLPATQAISMPYV